MYAWSGNVHLQAVLPVHIELLLIERGNYLVFLFIRKWPRWTTKYFVELYKNLQTIYLGLLSWQHLNDSECFWVFGLVGCLGCWPHYWSCQHGGQSSVSCKLRNPRKYIYLEELSDIYEIFDSRRSRYWQHLTKYIRRSIWTSSMRTKSLSHFRSRHPHPPRAQGRWGSWHGAWLHCPAPGAHPGAAWGAWPPPVPPSPHCWLAVCPAWRLWQGQWGANPSGCPQPQGGRTGPQPHTSSHTSSSCSCGHAPLHCSPPWLSWPPKLSGGGWPQWSPALCPCPQTRKELVGQLACHLTQAAGHQAPCGAPAPAPAPAPAQENMQKMFQIYKVNGNQHCSEMHPTMEGDC